MDISNKALYRAIQTFTALTFHFILVFTILGAWRPNANEINKTSKLYIKSTKFRKT